MLPDRPGHVAGVLPAALLQGKEADRVERHSYTSSRKKLPIGSRQTHPNIHPLWTSFSKQQVWLRGLKSSFHSCRRKSTEVFLRKKNKTTKRSTFLFLGLEHEKRCREEGTVRHGGQRWNAAVLIVFDLSLCAVWNVASHWIRPVPPTISWIMFDFWTQLNGCAMSECSSSLLLMSLFCHAKQTRSLVPFYQVKAKLFLFCFFSGLLFC